MSDTGPSWSRLAAVAGIALALRLAIAAQLAGGPIPQWHRWDDSDMAFHHAWAQRVAEGEWLGREPLHPCHSWHREVAARWFAAHPAEAARWAAHPDPARALWSHWYGGPRWHQEPLYPVALGVAYAAGAWPEQVLLAQLVLGAASLALVYAIADRWGGPRAAALAAALGLLYAPFVAHETVLLRTALEVFLGLAAVAACDRARARGTPADWRLAGLVAGLAAACRASLGLLALAVLALAIRQRRGWAALVGLAAIAAPIALRNAAVGAPLASITSVAAVTFASQNLPGTDPRAGFSIDPGALAQLMGSHEGAFWPTARATLQRHPDVSSAIRMVAARARVAVEAPEIANNASVAFARRDAPLLDALPLDFGVLAALAALGLAAALWRRPRPWPLFALIGAASAPQLAFYVLSRFRAPLAAALLPLAALGALALLQAARERRWGRAAAGLTAAAAVVALSWAGGRSEPPRAADFSIAERVWGVPRYAAALGAGRLDEALAVCERALALSAPECGRPAHTEREREIQRYAAGWELRRARTLHALGRPGEGQAALDRAATLEQASRPR